ncbi:MAG: hypothetical protein PHI79_01320 [Sulfurovaceae bacterium]|nr:hypothetical protein [Sulfurovaceae bacterium]MDD5548215.1 hypothetical protein [Sulfurovaceae bacterium]
MKDFIYLVITALSIFLIIFFGIIFGNTFTQKATYLELFILYGNILFIVSLLIVVAYFGFKYFSIFLAIVFSLIIFLGGIKGAFLAAILTYTIWGMMFAIQTLLFSQNVKGAKDWFGTRYTKKSFKREYIWFYPLLWVFYILLEIIPSIIYKDKLAIFRPSEILKKMNDFLEK